VELLRGVKYLPDTYVDRAGVDDAVRHWLNEGKKAALLLAADAGAGKTSLLCRLAEERLGGAESDAILLVLGGDVQRDADAGGRLFARIRTGLGLASEPALAFAGFAELLEAWRVKARRDDHGAERRLVLLVDAVNEGNDPASLLREATQLAHVAGEVNRKAGRVWVRLCLSIRAEYVFALRERDAGEDAPPFPHAQEFESHRDEMGKHWPWLTLRSFSEVEAAEAYALGRAHLAGHCVTSWEELESGARRLLHHPLRQRLFHEAFAGKAAPMGMAAEPGLWSAWLGRVFAGEGGAELRELALELADACIDAGQNALPPEFVADRRAVWQRAQEAAGQPVAGEMDPVQQLAAAGLLRRADDEGYDWLADALAEVVFELALLRRDPAVAEASLVAWAALPATARLDGALVRVGVGLWRAGRGEALVAWLGEAYARARKLVSEVVLAVAPLGRPEEIAEAAEHFAREVGDLCAAAVGTGVARKIEKLNDALMWDVGDKLEHRMGAVLAVGAIRRGSVRLAEALSGLEPDNTQYLRDLSISYSNLGDLDQRSDPTRARVWFEKGLAIFERLAALVPDNTEYLCGLAVSYGKLGALDHRSDRARARVWFEKGLAIRERLAALEPDNIKFAGDLGVSCGKLAEVALQLGNPAEERRYTWRYVAALRKATELDPDNDGNHYNLACALARGGDAPSALTTLQRATALGWTDADWAAEDADLLSLRSLPDFQAILDEMRERARNLVEQ
jgi:tetratricopeptide (TPR) repeat protein